MEAVKEFVNQIIYITIVAIIIELILPKGNTKKYVYIILSLFILLNVISPVVNIIKDADMQTVYDNVLAAISGNEVENNNMDIAVFSEYKNEKITENLKKELSKEIERMLNNMNVKLKDLDLTLTDEYTFESLEITIGNLDYLGESKDKKILDIITMLENEYEISNNVIEIIEEGE